MDPRGRPTGQASPGDVPDVQDAQVEGKYGDCSPSLLDVPAGYGGHGARLDLTAAPRLERLLASCEEEVALSLGVAAPGDAARLLQVGSPCTPGVAAGNRCVVGLFDAAGEMTAYLDVV